MKSKITIILLILFAIAQVSVGQKSKIRKGEKYYDNYSYEKSIKRYEAVTDKTTKIKRELAQSYFNIGDYKNAEKYFALTANADDKTSTDLYNYASILKVNKKYKEAEVWMMRFNKMDGSDSRGQRFMKNRDFYKKIQEDKGQFFIQTLTLNTDNEDFGTAYYKDKIVFASTKLTGRLIKRIWNGNNKPFLNLYAATVGDKMQLSVSEKFTKEINKKYHEGPASFNKKGDFMVFTRNNYKGKSSDGVIKLKLFTSEYKDGKWQSPEPMPFNSSEYSVGHPALTPDGNTMYFASDMPGGSGGTDIYVTHRKGNTWTNPENLGTKVNTEGNEMFPFIHENGMLFFASNGLLGLGGLDIFYTNIKNLTSSEPKNIGAPINTNYDDFAFVMDSVMASGYFSSNREGGAGGDDIYAFRIAKPFGIKVIGTAFDNEGNILAGTEINLYNEANELIETVVTDDAGKYSFTVDNDKTYRLEGNKNEYTKVEETINTANATEDIVQDLKLRKVPKFNLLCNITDSETKKALLGKINVKILNKKTGNIEDVTCTTGNFRQQLENIKLNDNLNYEFSFNKEGYRSKTYTYNQLIDHEGEYVVNVVMVRGLSIGDKININPIYFDFDKANIRPDAARELDNIVKVMNEYPTIYIELGSHTDCRGSDEYNLELSSRRAKSSAAYVKARITNPERIYGKGYGETKLVNKCKNGVECSEEEHQQNRRTEFVIVKE